MYKNLMVCELSIYTYFFISFGKFIKSLTKNPEVWYNIDSLT